MRDEWQHGETERGMQCARARERGTDIFSEAVGGGDIMEHNWGVEGRGGAAEGKGELGLQCIGTGGVRLWRGCFGATKEWLHERNVITQRLAHTRPCLPSIPK